MFKLFQKKPQGREGLQAQLADAQNRKDGARLAQACYDMGVYEMENGDPARAMLWLSRADTIFSARDDVYKKVGKTVREDCSERIRQLEDMPTMTSQLTAQVEEKAEELGEVQARLWGLLTMARLGKVGRRLAAIPGCGVLGELDRAAELVLRSFQEPVSQEEFGFLRDTCDRLYELGDADCFWGASQEAEVPGRPSMQVFDLNGLLTLTELNLYLDSHLTLLTEGEGSSGPETGLIPCGLLPDYYLRTGAGPLEDVPQVKAEVERIWDDYEFIRSGVTWKEMSDRLARYQELDLLA